MVSWPSLGLCEFWRIVWIQNLSARRQNARCCSDSVFLRAFFYDRTRSFLYDFQMTEINKLLFPLPFSSRFISIKWNIWKVFVVCSLCPCFHTKTLRHFLYLGRIVNIPSLRFVPGHKSENEWFSKEFWRLMEFIWFYLWLWTIKRNAALKIQYRWTSQGHWYIWIKFYEFI